MLEFKVHYRAEAQSGVQGVGAIVSSHRAVIAIDRNNARTEVVSALEGEGYFDIQVIRVELVEG